MRRLQEQNRKVLSRYCVSTYVGACDLSGNDVCDFHCLQYPSNSKGEISCGAYKVYASANWAIRSFRVRLFDLGSTSVADWFTMLRFPGVRFTCQRFTPSNALGRAIMGKLPPPFSLCKAWPRSMLKQEQNSVSLMGLTVNIMFPSGVGDEMLHECS